ncbi:MAG: VCBS repeat-containing protein [Candidatus Omnitrophota bacterium]
MKKLIIIVSFFMGATFFADGAMAYLENYPCLNKNEMTKLATLKSKLIMDKDTDRVAGEKTVQSGEISIHRIPNRETDGKPSQLSSTVELSYRSKIVARINNDQKYPYIGEIREADLDGNGLEDFIFIVSYMGNGIPIDAVILLLQTKKGEFKRLDYDTYSPSFNDFIDFNRDGKYEVVITSMSQLKGADGKYHSYWVYSVYEFAEFNLVIDNLLATGFPKFIWFTNRPNSKEAKNLSPAEKNGIIRSLPQVIESKSLKVFIKNGNAFLANNSEREVQLTHSGDNRAAVLSPDGVTVAFIHKSKEKAYLPSGSEEDYPAEDLLADQLWVVGADGSNERILVKERSPDEASKNIAEELERTIAHIEDDSISFSPDGKEIYFISSAWVTSGALHGVSVQSGKNQFIAPANSVKVIMEGPKKGCLIVEQHRYYEKGGSYDASFLFSPEGKEIGLWAKEY